jgi:hypothetical protein
VKGRELTLALGDEIVVGRSPEPGGARANSRGAEQTTQTRVREGRIAIASAAVSRRHLAIARRGADVVVRDLGSRNGTTLRGMILAGEGEVTVGERLELRLGREVPMVVSVVSPAPEGEVPGAVSIEIGGSRYLAPLGPASLGIGRWRLDRGEDDWVELSTDDAPPAFAAGLRLAPCITLLVGDAIAAERGSTPLFEVRDARDANEAPDHGQSRRGPHDE